MLPVPIACSDIRSSPQSSLWWRRLFSTTPSATTGRTPSMDCWSSWRGCRCSSGSDQKNYGSNRIKSLESMTYGGGGWGEFCVKILFKKICLDKLLGKELWGLDVCLSLLMSDRVSCGR